jgi:hypothetical protein
MNIRSFQVGIVVISIFILATIGIFQLFRSKILKVEELTFTNSSSQEESAPEPVGFAQLASPLPSPTPILGESALQRQPETGPGTLGIKNIGIFLKSPQSGTKVSSPVNVSGKANVLDGNVEIRVKDANGNLLGFTRTTACLGLDACPFEAEVTIKNSETLTGTVEAYNYSSPNLGNHYFQSVDINF